MTSDPLDVQPQFPEPLLYAVPHTPRRQGEPKSRAVPLFGKPTAVYRLLNKDDILLYVGISANVDERIKAHRREKPWWHLVEHVDIRTESAYGDFFADEYEACLNEFPVFNVDLVPWRCWRPSTGNKVFDRIRDRADIAGAVARLDDTGVRGRLNVLRKIFRGVYKSAVATVGPDVRSDEVWRRLVLIAVEERFLDMQRRPRRERSASIRAPAPSGLTKERA